MGALILVVRETCTSSIVQGTNSEILFLQHNWWHFVSYTIFSITIHFNIQNFTSFPK